MTDLPDPPPAKPQLSALTNRFIDKNILDSSRLPFSVSLTSVLAIIIVYAFQASGRSFLGAVTENDSPLVRFIIPNSIYILLSIVCLVSGYIGYRLTVAAGATTTPVIPPQDYALLAPLVSDGKAESIDQYVRLSSLAKFAGTFTQLGLTGLPLATIFLTLFFSILTLFQPDNYLDLTKLVLGAFIGSFVQRQVERRIDPGSQNAKESLSETGIPPSAK